MVENTHRITPSPYTFKDPETRTYKEPNWYFLRVYIFREFLLNYTDFLRVHINQYKCFQRVKN